MIENDPQATFRQDQEAAEAEDRTRDQVQWDLHVQDAAAQVDMKRAAAANEQAKASLWGAASVAIYGGVLLGGIYAGAWGVTKVAQTVVGWFQ